MKMCIRDSYGNMPLIEPLESKEVKKTEEEFGAFYCKDITHLDWGVIMEKCPGLIADTYTKVMEILTERDVYKRQVCNI